MASGRTDRVVCTQDPDASQTMAGWGGGPLQLELTPRGYRIRHASHMSTLWTPDGDHPVDPSPAAPGTDATTDAEVDRAAAEAMANELMETRRQLLEIDASVVVANHAMGIYELAAIHLTADEPDMDQARIAIDALGGLVESLGERWGEHRATLDEALHSIRLVFVQRHAELNAAED